MAPEIELMSQELRAALDEESAMRAPTAVRARLWTRVEATLALPPMADSTGRAAVPSLKPSFLRAHLPSRIVSLIVGSAVGVAGHVAYQRLTAPTPISAPVQISSSAPAPLIVATPIVPTSIIPTSIIPAVPEMQQVVSKHRKQKVNASDGRSEPGRGASPASLGGGGGRVPLSGDTGRVSLSDSAAERNVLEAVRSALARGNADAAIAGTERHQREFPAGQLGEERDALWIQALVSAGRFDDARTRAARFHQDHSNSLLAPAVDAAVGSIPVTNSGRSHQ